METNKILKENTFNTIVIPSLVQKQGAVYI
jgi:hypothetical protein